MKDLDNLVVATFNLEANDSLFSSGAEPGNIWFFPKSATKDSDIKPVPGTNLAEF